MTNGLNLRPYEPKTKGIGRLQTHKGDIFCGYLIKELFRDEKDKIVYLVECTTCKRESYMRMTHKGKVVGCRSCTALNGNNRLEHKIGTRYGTYLITGIIRGEDKVPYYTIKCDCGHKGTRRNLKRLSACVKCKYKDSPQNRVGRRFGKLIYTEYLGKSKYKAKCDCGNECTIVKDTKSCGCLKNDNVLDNAKRWIGIKKGVLTIVDVHQLPSENDEGRTIFKIKCKCGNYINRSLSDLWSIKSCGCQINKTIKNGERAWNAKLTDKEAQTIRELYVSGEYTQQDLREMFQIDKTTLYRILRSKSYAQA